MSEPDARRLTERIKLLLGSVNDQMDRLGRLVTEARDGGAHLALGYRSWTEYVAAEFGSEPLRLGRDDRRALVAELTAAGMPTRAIAPVLGVGKSTVDRDRDAVAPVPNGTPAEVIGRDGKTYTVEPKKSISVEQGKSTTRPDVLCNTRRPDPVRVKHKPARMISETTYALEGLRIGLDLVEPHRYAELDRADVVACVDVLNGLAAILNRIVGGAS